MKTRNHLMIHFCLPILLLIQSCGQDSPIKEEQLNITSSDMTVNFKEPEVMEASFDSNFEDESRTQTNNLDYSEGFSMESASPTYMVSSNANTSASPKKQIKKDKKIIKNGTMRIESNTFYESKKRIDQTVKALKGYYENEELDKNDYRIQYHLIIRLPSRNFEQLVHGIEDGKDEILFKKINVNDVTEEFLDIETRLENKRKYLQRYKELLAKAKNVNEILSIEENIRQLMEEIESKEGRLKYLNDQVDLSTLRITLFKEHPVKVDKPVDNPFSSRAGKSLGSGWDSIINFLLWIVSKWPIILLLSIAAWIARRRWKKRKMEKTIS
ncbi:DUF4349 domain-containing protein [Fluviicola taffensis]|uniref:DUF4349 domain-containing protein n=1 Tax=Fluviicola taffensis TaxID=191579 RepID=UPI003137884F